MMTFLDLVNAFITELGINGGVLLSSTGGGTLSVSTTPGQGSSTSAAEVARIVSFVADADYEIQSLHHDWNFLWRQYRGTMAVGQDWLATPRTFQASSIPTGYSQSLYSIRRVDRDSLTINYTSTTQAFRPKFQPWRQFERNWQSRGNKLSSDYPTNWTVTPAGEILLSHASQTGLPYQYECWIRPRRLQADGDVSPLMQVVANADAPTSLTEQLPPIVTTPTTSSSLNSRNPVVSNPTATAGRRYESCRIIIVRAKIIWAEVEGAVDIMQGALAEYEDLLEELRADQLEGMYNDRMSAADTPLEIVSI